jgi:hypothetical protein
MGFNKNKLKSSNDNNGNSIDVESVKSVLSKEVQSVPLYHLRRLFKGKLSEYNQCKMKNKMTDFDSDTIFRADVNESYKK